MSASSGPDRGHLATEAANPRSAGLERLDARAAVDLMVSEDRAAVAAVEGAREDLAALIELTSARLAAGGRLVYVGAGTSGRLAVLDASECPPTFGVDPGLVRAIIVIIIVPLFLIFSLITASIIPLVHIHFFLFFFFFIIIIICVIPPTAIHHLHRAFSRVFQRLPCPNRLQRATLDRFFEFP